MLALRNSFVTATRQLLSASQSSNLGRSRCCKPPRRSAHSRKLSSGFACARARCEVPHFVRDDRWPSATFLRWSDMRFLRLLRADADFFQKGLDGLFAAEEFFDRDVYVTRIARLVDFAAQFYARLFVEVTTLGFFENGRQICSDGVGPGVTVITRIVAIQVTEIGNERGARIDWEKNLFQDRI